MKFVENVMHGIEGSFTEAHKSFPMHYGAWGFLKRIVINLPPSKDNEINIFQSDVQNHVSYHTGISYSFRIIQMITDILWTMLGNGWKFIFNRVLWFLTLSNEVEKMHLIYLSVRLSKL